MKICPKCNIKHTKKGSHCSRKCANSRAWSPEDRKKKSDGMKRFLEKNGVHPSKGKPGWTHSDEMKELKRQKALAQWDAIGRRTPEEIRIKNAVVSARYRARIASNIPEDSDMMLIKLIFKYCPEGYEVDHIIPVSKGGLHHQDNFQYLTSLENKRKSNKLDYVPQSAIRWQDINELQEEYMLQRSLIEQG